MNEIAVIRHAAADVDAYRASTEAADMCKAIVVATSSTIQNRRYVAVEGWQAIAVAHGCALGAKDVERVDGGVRAIGEVRRMSDGQLIATAEGFVGEDEPTWYGGDSRGRKLPKRADYAIRAMAQTRAMSRAGRSAFAHVVVMMNAGLATTPAEEMVTFDTGTGEIIEGEAIDKKIPGITKIRNNLNKLRRDGGKATDLEEFNALVSANKDDLQKIRDAHHTLWTGMGEDFDGFNRWIRTRREELTPPERSTSYQLLVSNVEECTNNGELSALLARHSEAIEMLDGEESREFERIYDAKAESFKTKAPTPLETGLVGG
jgi:hypothetical protein